MENIVVATFSTKPEVGRELSQVKSLDLGDY
jgi:hypothetical protein